MLGGTSFGAVVSKRRTSPRRKAPFFVAVCFAEAKRLFFGVCVCVFLSGFAGLGLPPESPLENSAVQALASGGGPARPLR